MRTDLKVGLVAVLAFVFATDAAAQSRYIVHYALVGTDVECETNPTLRGGYTVAPLVQNSEADSKQFTDVVRAQYKPSYVSTSYFTIGPRNQPFIGIVEIQGTCALRKDARRRPVVIYQILSGKDLADVEAKARSFAKNNWYNSHRIIPVDYAAAIKLLEEGNKPVFVPLGSP